MRKARCCLCKREIGLNEHYFIFKQGSVCRECKSEFKGKLSEVCNSNSDNTDCMGESNKGA